MADRAITEALAALLDRIAAEDAAGIVAEARAEARARVRTLLADALCERLLDQAAPGRSEPSSPRRAPAPPARAAEPAPPAGTVMYVYGVVDDDAVELPPAGLDGTTLELAEGGGLWAVASTVPAAAFGDDQLKEHLNDLAWLERTAREHEAVVEALVDAGPVVPMRLCTIFRDEERVREMLVREAYTLRRALERVRGREELGVKVIAQPVAAGDEESAIRGDDARVPDGQAYMLRRREERDAVARRRDRLGAWTAEIHDELAALAVDARVNPPTSRELAGYEGDMVLNGAYLVAARDVAAFRARVGELAERFAARGLAMQLTGPWPPYNFTESLGAP